MVKIEIFKIILNYIQHSAIFGNIVVTLGIAEYCLYCLINSKFMKIPKLISTHVFADDYSEAWVA